MSEQKFKSGDRVRVIDVNPFVDPTRQKPDIVAGYSENGNRVLVEGGFGYHEHRLQLLKPLTDLWEDEKTCEGVMRLIYAEFFRYEKADRIPGNEEWTQLFGWVKDFAGIETAVFVGIRDKGAIVPESIDMHQIVSLPFFELAQLLTEAGYYPVE